MASYYFIFFLYFKLLATLDNIGNVTVALLLIKFACNTVKGFRKSKWILFVRSSSLPCIFIPL